MKQFVVRNPEGAFVPRPIEPTDSPEVRDVTVDEQKILVDAVERRPEVLQARYEIENRRILPKINRNNLLPGPNVNTTYGLNGLSGRGVPQIDPKTGQTVVSPFTGGYWKSIERLKSDDFNSYSAGQRVTAARAAETQAPIDYNVSLAALRQAEGTLLAQFDVVIDTLPPHPTPLWF